MDSVCCAVAIPSPVAKARSRERHSKYARSVTTLIIPFIASYRNYEVLKLFWGYGVHMGTAIAQDSKFLHTLSAQVEVFYSAKWNYLNISFKVKYYYLLK